MIAYKARSSRGVVVALCIFCWLEVHRLLESLGGAGTVVRMLLDR